MEHRFGTITIKTEIKEPETKIDCFRDGTSRYSHLGDKQKEHFYAVFLTGGNEEIGDKLIGFGGLDAAPVDVQDVVRTAVLVKAGAVILVHNHPSGKAEAGQSSMASSASYIE